MKTVEPALAFSPSRLTRRLVLGAALLGALIVWMPPKASPAQAQSVPAAPGTPAVQDATVAPRPAGALKAEGKLGSDGFKARITVDTDAKTGQDVDAAPAGDRHRPAIVVEKDGKKVQVFGIHSDAEYDSFSDLVNQEPWLAALIFFSVAMLFLLPLLLVLALIWYKMRKNRMLNETMLKLAEKGVVPPAEAMDAISGSTLRAAPASAALYERAKEVRSRTAWSDLRKGVVMGAIGLGLTFNSMLDDGTPNGLGLVLLFVGIGYAILWWFEDRNLAAPRAGTGSSPPASP
jgi:hypothetical protein